MWLCVDRVAGGTVILLDDDGRVFSLSVEDCAALTGQAPTESAMLRAEVKDGQILSAAYDESETRRRREAARKRLDRLFGQSKKGS